MEKYREGRKELRCVDLEKAYDNSKHYLIGPKLAQLTFSGITVLGRFWFTVTESLISAQRRGIGPIQVCQY